jgi:hypothetical protein
LVRAQKLSLGRLQLALRQQHRTERSMRRFDLGSKFDRMREVIASRSQIVRIGSRNSRSHGGIYRGNSIRRDLAARLLRD